MADNPVVPPLSRFGRPAPGRPLFCRWQRVVVWRGVASRGVESVIVKDAPIHISGIKVGVRPGDFESVRAGIARLEGLEIAAEDRRAGRMALVQERPTIEEHADGLRAVQALPGVCYAELVCHYREPEEI